MTAQPFLIAWFFWGASWIAAALWSSAPASRLGVGAEATHRALTVIGALIMIGFIPLRLGRLWRVDAVGYWALLAVTVAGFAFTWWARWTLGALWSGSVTRKQDHKIIESGPYAIVRHPIYTGLIVSLLATAGATGRVNMLIGVAVIAFGFWVKARFEERFLSAELGADAYADYRRRVPMLVPFLRGRAG